MNPPSALQSAMGRERKPFTYTPGGINLSEIKSERMAKRLMRNAMNEGVPQTPVHNLQSPTTPTTPLNVPNYNCMPVQVFPAFSLPANPKSLLRNRSMPGQQKEQPPAFHQHNSAATLPSNGSTKCDAQKQGVVNNSGMNQGPSLYNQMPSYINQAPQKDAPVQETYSPYQFDTLQPCNDAVFMDTRNDKVQQPSSMYSYTNNTVHNPEMVTRRVVPPFQYNPATTSHNEPPKDTNDGVKSELKYSTLPSYINSSVSSTDSMSQKPLNLYEFNATSNNSSQDSYKTIESDGDQPNTFCSNIPSSDHPMQFKLNTSTKTPYSVENLAVLQQQQNTNKDQNEIQIGEENNVTSNNDFRDQHDNSNATYNPMELQESESNVSIKPIYGENVYSAINEADTMSFDHDVKLNENIVNKSIKPGSDNLFMSMEEKSQSNHNEQLIEVKDDTTDIQSEVKVVKKVKKQTEETKQTENGDESEAALTVKLPTKKSAAKTETKVEVRQKVLPDGTIEETKKTITKTTIDGRTEISTRTETRTIPKDEQSEEEVEEEEEEEYEDDGVAVEGVKANGNESEKNITNGEVSVIKKEERSETMTTKNVVVVQNNAKEEQDEEVQEEEEVVVQVEEVPVKREENPVEIKPQPPTSAPPAKPVEIEQEEEVEEEEEDQEQVVEQTVQLKKTLGKIETKVEKSDVVLEKVQVSEVTKEEDEEVEEEEDYEEAEEKPVEVEVRVVAKPEPELNPEPIKSQDEEEEEYTEEEVETEDEASKAPPKVEEKVPKPEEPNSEPKPEPKEEPVPTSAPVPEPEPTPVLEPQKEAAEPPKPVEIPILFDKVEDIEIKPIAPQESITKTEKTEITTSKDSDGNAVSTKTEMHRIENVVVSNRVTKTLDQSYEQLTQGLPTMKTYFAPNRERVDISPAKVYQPTYQPSEPPTERRHSLLLERLSMERQASPAAYQNQTYQSLNSNQSYETQRDWSQEPQSEVVNISNVKPSAISKNQQWYQNQNENATYNNVAPTPAPQQYSQPSPQPQYQPPAPPQQPQYQPPAPLQPQYQTPAQPIYQAQHQPPTPQPQTYTDSYSRNYSQQKTTQNTYQQNSYPTYTPQPTSWGSNNVDSSTTNQYSYQNQEQKSTQQQYSSSYVPPPWEQDSTYAAPPTTTNYFQPPPLTNEFEANASVPGWKPAPPTTGKFSKPVPKAYVPPAPNQSFVKPVTVSEPPRNLPGRKTYYSEYERRYISVPESTYVPGETKYQQQPDPSPQYYYDNDEVPEKVEPEWRRELREFTEKTSQTYSSDQGTQSQYQSQTQTQYQTDQGTQSSYQSSYQTETSARPPWEQDAQYTKTPSVTYTPTPSWSQTLRPNSGRERTFESDYVSQTNTLGRNRPLSFVESNNTPLPGRSRGVSVDRYNPNSYHSPIPTEHSPVQSHTLDPATAPPPKIYHNPSVPAYHSRASAEPREQPAPYPQARNYSERASPLQSRSFKYLQWITGTDE